MNGLVVDTKKRANRHRRPALLGMPCARWYLAQQERSVGVGTGTRHYWIAKAIGVDLSRRRIHVGSDTEDHAFDVPGVPLHRNSGGCERQLIREAPHVRQQHPRGDPWIPHVQREIAVESL